MAHKHFTHVTKSRIIGDYATNKMVTRLSKRIVVFLKDPFWVQIYLLRLIVLYAMIIKQNDYQTDERISFRVITIKFSITRL